MRRMPTQAPPFLIKYMRACTHNKNRRPSDVYFFSIKFRMAKRLRRLSAYLSSAKYLMVRTIWLV